MRSLSLLVLLVACDAGKDEVAALRQQVTRVEQEVATTQRALAQLEAKQLEVETKLAALQREAEARPVPAAPASTLAIADDGGLKLDDAAVEAAALQARLCELAKARPGLALEIVAGEKVPHAQVVQLLDAAKACAIVKVSLAVRR